MGAAAAGYGKVSHHIRIFVDAWPSEQNTVALILRFCEAHWLTATRISATPIHRGGPAKGKPVNVPDHKPPPGYICYRCGEKGRFSVLMFETVADLVLLGHWIQMCPTNNNPNFDGRPRVKRTTGIPRSFLKTIEKPAVLTNDGTADDTKQPSGVMVNAEGEFVVAEPDKASWEQYQAKAKASAAAQQAAVTGSEELREKGLECSIDKRMFVEPTRTPCCGRTYCNDCIINALIESDLVCPGCSTEGVLIDNLSPDDEMAAKIEAYEDKKAGTRRSEELAGDTPAKESATLAHKSQDVKPASPSKFEDSSSTAANSQSARNPRKRPAEDELPNQRSPDSHGVKGSGNLQRQTLQQQPTLTNGFGSYQVGQSQGQLQGPAPDMALAHHLPFMGSSFMPSQGMNPMAYVPANGYAGLAAGMPSVMGINNGMMDSTMMTSNAYNSTNGSAWNNMGSTGFFQPPNAMYGSNYANGMMANGSYPNGMQFAVGPMSMGINGAGLGNIQPQQMLGTGKGSGSFLNQQRTTFSEPFPNEEDNAYFRKPVNPHRHQARQRRVRPSDYREL